MKSPGGWACIELRTNMQAMHLLTSPLTYLIGIHAKPIDKIEIALDLSSVVCVNVVAHLL